MAWQVILDLLDGVAYSLISQITRRGWVFLCGVCDCVASISMNFIYRVIFLFEQTAVYNANACLFVEIHVHATTLF